MMMTYKMYLFTMAFLILFACNKQKEEKRPNEDFQRIITPTGTWDLVWNEEFDYDGLPDTTKWSYDTQGNAWGWGNNEAQYYTAADPDNASVKNGILTITARMETMENKRYTSARLITKEKGDWLYGRFEICAKLPRGKGTWPAIWMLPTQSEYGKWPASGEIDIMERLNDEGIAYQTVHSHYTHVLKETYPPKGATGAIRADDYNTYAVELYPDSVSFYINNRHTFTYPRIETDKQGQFPFDREFYLLLDMQLGGRWVGRVEPAHLPVEMQIDWVRFYQKQK